MEGLPSAVQDARTIMARELQQRFFTGDPNNNDLMQMFLDPSIKPALATLVGEAMQGRARQLVQDSAKRRMPSKFYRSVSESSKGAATPQAASSSSQPASISQASPAQAFDLAAQLRQFNQVSSSQSTRQEVSCCCSINCLCGVSHD